MFSFQCPSAGWVDWVADQGADEGAQKNWPEGARKRAGQLFLLIQFQDEQKFKFLNFYPGRKNSQGYSWRSFFLQIRIVLKFAESNLP
jgi:hypothetical protein